MLENVVEEYLVKRVKEIGGLCPKFTSPGLRGVPDRIILYRGMRKVFTIFVETKQPDGVLRKQQERRIKQFRDLGQIVEVAYTKEAVDAIIEAILKYDQVSRW